MVLSLGEALRNDVAESLVREILDWIRYVEQPGL